MSVMVLMNSLKCGRDEGSLKCPRKSKKRLLHAGLPKKPSVLLVSVPLMMLILFADQVRVLSLSVTV